MVKVNGLSTKQFKHCQMTPGDTWIDCMKIMYDGATREFRSNRTATYLVALRGTLAFVQRSVSKKNRQP